MFRNSTTDQAVKGLVRDLAALVAVGAFIASFMLVALSTAGLGNAEPAPAASNASVMAVAREVRP